MNTDNNTIDGQIAEVKALDNALVILNPQQFATELFKPFEDQLASAKRAASRVKYDIATKEGMTKAKELRATFVSIRTTADKAKTAAKRPIDESGKLILAHFNKLAEAAKAEEAKHDQAIKDEEARIEAEKQAKIAAERVRIEAIEGRIAHIRGIPEKFRDAESEVVQAMLDKMLQTQLEPAKYDEHLEEALTEWNRTIDTLRNLHQQALAREEEARRVAAERAELERLRAEQAERERAERAAEAERQRQMADMRAQQEAAAAALARQQEQMTAIMEIQGLAAALQAAGEDRNPDAIEAALKKAVSFNPSEFGAMTAMARMARDSVIPMLESLMDALPMPEVPDPEPVTYAPAEEGARIIGIDLTPEGDAVPQPIGAAVQEPMRVEPEPTPGPTDDDIIELMMNEFHMSTKEVLDRLALFNFARAYDKLAEPV
jgi:hypothetical protein